MADQPSPRSRLFKLLRPLFGIALLCALLALVDFAKVGAALRSVAPAWVAASLGILVCGTLLGAIAVHLLLNIEKRLPFRQFLPVYWTAWAVGLVFPGQVGDMATMSSMLRRHQLPASITLGRTLADKLVSLTLMMAFALWAVRAYPFFPLVLAAAVAGLLGLALLVLGRRHLPGQAYLERSKPVAFLRAALSEAARFARAHPGLIMINTLLTALKIYLTGSAYWCMFGAFGFHGASPLDITFLVAITSLVAYIPISFNGIGTAEAAGIAVFGSVGMTPAAVLGSYLLFRTLGLALAWIPAGLWLLLARPAAKAGGQNVE